MTHEPLTVLTPTPADAAGSGEGTPIAPPIDRQRLRECVEALPAEAHLVGHGSLEVFIAPADAIEPVVYEIGRLREVAFRAVGEGTGAEIDLDQFDHTYQHLFVWHRDDHEVVGAYRLGHIDELVAASGVEGLYTATLWDFAPELFERLGPSLELGRSFIQPRYQRLPTSLFLLWKGIGHYVVRHPRYRQLVGPVSISNDYHPRSRALMARFLRQHCAAPELKGLARPTHPFPMQLPAHQPCPADIGELELQVDAIEGRRRSLPVLLKEYLRLGGRLVELNVDPLFGNVLDALIAVDLDRTAPRRLARYMGEHRDAFLAAKTA